MNWEDKKANMVQHKHMNRTLQSDPDFLQSRTYLQNLPTSQSSSQSTQQPSDNRENKKRKSNNDGTEQNRVKKYTLRSSEPMHAFRFGNIGGFKSKKSKMKKNKKTRRSKRK